jgi:hypothetical protein
MRLILMESDRLDGEVGGVPRNRHECELNFPSKRINRKINTPLLSLA